MIVLAVLNLLRLLRDETLNKLDDSSKDLHSSKSKTSGTLGISYGRWLAYVRFIRRQSPLVSALITTLNVCVSLQVPLEMILNKMILTPLRLKIIAIYELTK